MADEKEDWGDFDATQQDGMEDVPYFSFSRSENSIDKNLCLYLYKTYV